MSEVTKTENQARSVLTGIRAKRPRRPRNYVYIAKSTERNSVALDESSRQGDNGAVHNGPRLSPSPASAARAHAAGAAGAAGLQRLQSQSRSHSEAASAQASASSSASSAGRRRAAPAHPLAGPLRRQPGPGPRRRAQ